MTESDEVEFQERVAVAPPPAVASLPARAGIAVGAAVLVVVGAVAAMGASPAPSVSALPVELSTVVEPMADVEVGVTFDHGLRGGFGPGPFRAITVTAISGSSLSLQTEDGWSRTITVNDATTITRGGETIALGDLAVGDTIRFGQERQSDGSYTITAINVVLPTIGGEVTAISGNTITVTGRDGATGTIHVDGDTTYDDRDGTAALSDIEVGDLVIAQGTLRDDGSLDADVVHTGKPFFRDGFREGFRDGLRRGPGFPDPDGDPSATPTPNTSSSAS